ncbi:hypothetical protein [Actinomadura chibensis]|uniref:Uncharacterized protein n=1 Tax=Actinomadura chibensis TaxID=392828 RepID=A0A5D0NHS2_9ACTN|nr:hypothetical protein [Actinomadura chibensis]TYB43960.1 hypothetical protein FXF69_23640 [Actinomadura chibensis]
MSSWEWRIENPKQLARFVVPHLFISHRLLPPDIRALRDDHPFTLAGRLYELLRDEGIRYDREPLNLRGRQTVRQPVGILENQGVANCLDLSLLYAGQCAAALLRPLVVLLRTGEGDFHTLVLVSRLLAEASEYDVWDALPFQDGQAEPTPAQLARTLTDERMVPVDLTVATDLLGRLPFRDACAHAAETIRLASSVTAVIDPLHLHAIEDWPPDEDAISLFGHFPGNPRFHRDVAERFGADLRAGLGYEPPVWDLLHISKLPTQPGTRAHDTRLALEEALQALGPFEAVGGRKPGVSRLQTIYHRATRNDTGAESPEVMLVQAASIKGRQDHLPRLVRFVIGVAASQRGRLDPEAKAALNRWLRGQDVQKEDVRDYRRSCRAVTYWALIYLGDEIQEGAQPRKLKLRIVVDPPLSVTDPLEAEWDPADEEELRASLSGLLDRLLNRLPDDGSRLVVDLVAPYHLLTRGIERWDVVPNGRRLQPLSPQYKPRVRWLHHLEDRRGRDRQRFRDDGADWDRLPPTLVPAAATRDLARLEKWLGTTDARRGPFLIAGRTRSSCDPLLRMLDEGHGFILWYDSNHERAAASVQHVWDGLVGGERYRRANLPDRVFDLLPAPYPVMIWNDLSGRGDSRLVAGRLQAPHEGPLGGTS